ncbi:unnamed protein product [Phytophthora fragariaefolia]|uniref:Unnamed protein product n=1 Tax=Phytophthora fragariaefolia TaxID=1490495 RepID=A0A9W7CXH3_9STRA|nr:unnamed protein product [Phytophthora fragariaefolia]
MLRTLSPAEQHGVALGFIMKEQREVAARATVSTLSTPRVESLKLHVNSYVGREGDSLLRWLVEVDTPIMARRIVDPLSKVAFAMSCLGGRARRWAYGRRLTDPTCFSTYEVFKQELRQAFEPPQNEFRSRAEFLDLQQGKHDVHAYAQIAQYLVSNIVTNPIDEATKVVTFMMGLRDGSVKTYLFREYPSTLEAAIMLAMQEGFSLQQAKLHANVPRQMPRPAMKPTGGPESMDLSSATAAGSQQRRGSTNVRCFRCGNNGHYARECTAPVHATKGRRDDTGLGFEEAKLPRSLLEVRLATGVVVRTEKRVVRARFSYEEKKFVDELIVLDLHDKFDMVLGMPWLARHDPVIDWAKRTIMCFRISVRDRDVASSVCRADTATGDNRRDPERLDAYGYWSPASEDGAREPSDASVRVDFTSSYERKAFARDLHDERIEQICILSDVGRMKSEAEELKQLVTEGADVLTAVSTPSGTIWEWLVMPQGLKNVPATFNRCAFDAVKQGLTEAPILAVADQDRPFHVVCDASDFAIGCALMQHDHVGRDRVVYYQWRQLKPVERNYPVHDKELLAMKYALAKFRVYLLGSRPFVVYTDHASLRTAIKSLHITQRMARWFSFFAEYNFQVEYKPGRLNVVADALSRRPDYAVHKTDANAIGVIRTSTPSSSLLDDVRSAHANDADTKQLLNYFAVPSEKSRQKLSKHLPEAQDHL